jgi:Flp pilus assembly protein TadD
MALRKLAIQFAAAVLGLGWLSAPHAAAPNSAEIVSISGKGEYRPQATAAWNPARVSQRLLGGHFVRTLDDSAMALLFSDKSQLKLSRNSMFEIKAIGDGSTTDTTISLTKGKSWMQSKPAPGRLRMETPGATAGIHGTDWVMEVDDAGNTVLTVLAGEIEFANALGAVTVRSSEQAVASPGRAPEKRLLQNPRDRVQWVTAYRADPSRYRDIAEATVFAPLRAALADGRVQDARAMLTERLRKDPAALASGWLLASDFALMAGEIDEARAHLSGGASRHPKDDRFPAYQARAAMFAGDWDQARAIVKTGRSVFPDSVELALVAGEIARFDGSGPQAVAEFEAAVARAPQDARAWHGLGVTQAEREHFAPARQALTQAATLAPQAAAPLADLGSLETLAQRWRQAETAIDQALVLQPDDYVAWTSRGVLLLLQGRPEDALEALLKASLLEPRFARAQLHSAIAWYQLGRRDAALSALEKAKALDPKDPLPHYYEAMMQQDALDPMAAVAAAREALQRYPYLKSLAPIATDKQGSANLGSAYALFGLESWARRMALESQHPFFAGSYIFLAERTAEPYLRNSALVQGYLTDPTLFGASPKLSTLVRSPGGHVSVGYAVSRSPGVSSGEPSITANGYTVSPVPVAGFVEMVAPRFRSGDVVFEATAPSLVTAIGLRPSAQWGVFLYRDEFRPRIERVSVDTADDRISGDVYRNDLGASWQIDPQTAMWARFGEGANDTLVSSRVQPWERSFHRRDRDSGLRLTLRRATGEWTVGWEEGRTTTPGQIETRGINLVDNRTGSEGSGSRLFLSWKGAAGPWRLQADLDRSTFNFDQSRYSLVTQISSGRQFTFGEAPISEQRDSWSPRIGIAWSPSAGATYRFAWQRLVRPATGASLAPLDTAGISLDVPGLQPGGRLKRSRAQGEWELGASSFMTAFVDHREIRNLYGPDGQTLNAEASLAQYDRLRQQGLAGVLSPEALEAPPVFASGTINTAGLIFERIASDRWSWSANYIYSQTVNDPYPLASLPYLPKHRLGFGVNWFAPARWVIRAQAVRRSERFADATGNSRLEPDWDVSLRATWQDSAKRSLVELYASNLARDDNTRTVGLRVILRF